MDAATDCNFMATAIQRAACHQIGAAAFVRIHGTDRRWFRATVTCAAPLTARIIDPDKIWHGCEVTRRDALIRVDASSWPKERLIAESDAAKARSE